MNKFNYYIYWKNNSKEGIFNIIIDNDGYITLQTYEGNAIDDIVLSNIILSWTPIRNVIEDVLETINNIQYQKKFDYIKNTFDDSTDEYISYSSNDKRKVWHTNNNGEFDEDLRIFIPDLINFVEYTWEGKFSNTPPINNLKRAAANLDEIAVIKL